MTYAIEAQFNKDVLWTLREIEKELLVTPDDEYLVYELHRPEGPGINNSPSFEDQRRVIKKLVQLGAFTIYKTRTSSLPLSLGALGIVMGEKPTVYLLDINKDKFDEVYLIYLKKNDPYSVEVYQMEDRIKRKQLAPPSPQTPTAPKDDPAETPINWPDKFKWSEDGRSYLLGDKEFKFGTTNGDRTKIFKALVDKKGEWMEVMQIAKELNKDDSNVRTIINQLSDRIKNEELHSYIKIQSRHELDKRGAYRIIPFPKAESA